jgi:hypothetical protein
VQFAEIGFVEQIEEYRDRRWRREPELRVENAFMAEQFVNDVGFCSALTDVRQPGPSLYIAVCGRRDAHMPRNVQKDPESSLAWSIKDHVMMNGRVYYGKLIKGRASFIARRLIPHFDALWGVPCDAERSRLSGDAVKVLAILREEWEMASSDLRKASGITDRVRFNKAIDELQRRFKIIPAQVLYHPTFTYVWSLIESRFSEELKAVVNREKALREIAQAYLLGAGMTARGELARVTGLSRPDAGLGYWALVEEGAAVRLGPGLYCLEEFRSLVSRSSAMGAGS